jgi:hypothetical protein
MSEDNTGHSDDRDGWADAAAATAVVTLVVVGVVYWLSTFPA